MPLLRLQASHVPPRHAGTCLIMSSFGVRRKSKHRNLSFSCGVVVGVKEETINSNAGRGEDRPREISGRMDAHVAFQASGCRVENRIGGIGYKEEQANAN